MITDGYWFNTESKQKYYKSSWKLVSWIFAGAKSVWLSLHLNQTDFAPASCCFIVHEDKILFIFWWCRLSDTSNSDTGKVKSDEGDVFSSSCGWRWRDYTADCQIPPLSWPSVLWGTSVSRPANWDLNNGGHSVCSDKPLCCSHHAPPLLSPWTPSPPPLPPC